MIFCWFLIGSNSFSPDTSLFWTASYIFDALLGWVTRRLEPSSIPIDIAKYIEDPNYRALFPNHDSQAKTKLMGMSREDLISVTTWSGPGVNKQDMFEKLQRTFFMGNATNLERV